MKPSFPQNPPLLVRASTCLTTWEEAAMRLSGWAAGSQPAAPRSQGLCPAAQGPRKNLRPPCDLKGVVVQVESVVQQPATKLSSTRGTFPEHLFSCAGCWGQTRRKGGGNPAFAWGRAECRAGAR